MRILVTGVCNNMGGIESFFHSYFSELLKCYHDIQFDVLGYNGYVFQNEIVMAGGCVFKISSFSKNEIVSFMEKHAADYDIIWCNVVDLSSISIMKYAKIYGAKKIILHSHCSSMMGAGLNKIKKYLLHYFNRNLVTHYVDEFWACSDYAAKWMFPKMAFYNNVRYIPNAIDASKYRFCLNKRNEMRVRLKCGQALSIGFIGRLSSEKNPKFAIEVYRKLADNMNSKLYIVGDGPLEKEIHDEITENNLNNVEMLGRRNDVSEILQALDCVIMPSLFEGMPMVAIEAQASGLPVFLSSNHITAQTKITQGVEFLNLKDGPEKWANQILSSNLQRNDTFEQIVEAGYEIKSASSNLYKIFKDLTEDN